MIRTKRPVSTRRWTVEATTKIEQLPIHLEVGSVILSKLKVPLQSLPRGAQTIVLVHERRASDTTVARVRGAVRAFVETADARRLRQTVEPVALPSQRAQWPDFIADRVNDAGERVLVFIDINKKALRAAITDRARIKEEIQLGRVDDGALRELHDAEVAITAATTALNDLPEDAWIAARVARLQAMRKENLEHLDRITTELECDRSTSERRQIRGAEYAIAAAATLLKCMPDDAWLDTRSRRLWTIMRHAQERSVRISKDIKLGRVAGALRGMRDAELTAEAAMVALNCMPEDLGQRRTQRRRGTTGASGNIRRAAPRVDPLHAQALDRRNDLLQAETWLTSVDVEKQLRGEGLESNPHAYASRLRRERRLLGARTGGEFLHPVFQFDPSSGALRPKVAELAALLPTSADGWTAMFWLFQPRQRLANARPADLFAKDPEAVIEAARRSFVGADDDA